MQVKERHFFSHYPSTKTNKSHLMLLAKNVNPKVTIQERAISMRTGLEKIIREEKNIGN
jgi:hypothetical protein